VDRLSLVVVEAAVELVPPGISDHPSVRRYAERRGRRPAAVLLDRSYHHAAMKGLKDAHKRGRPDIVYHILLDAMGTPLYAAGRLALYVDTRDGMVMRVGEGVHLPRSYHRFIGLLEDLYYKGAIIADNGEELMSMRRMRLRDLMEELSPDRAILLRESGAATSLGDLAASLASAGNPLVGIGGFPAGDFSDEVLELFPERASLGERSYDASLLACRLIYEVERASLGGPST